jgi:TolB-like protein
MLLSSNREKITRLADVAFRKERGTAAPLASFPTPFAMPDTSFRWNTQSQLARSHIHEPAIHPTAASDTSKEISPSRLTIERQLSHMLRSRIFIHSDKLSKFLRFVVEHVIDGNASCLKEYLIGAEVYDRRPPYHPSHDSIVRTEARRLRAKLKEYYDAEGKEDPVFVYLRPGSYVPVFQTREDLLGTQRSTEPESLLLPQRPSSIAIAVLPFSDISGNRLSSMYALGIADELAYLLATTSGFTVVSSSSTVCFGARDSSPTEIKSRMEARIAYEGSVRVEAKHLRVTARIVDANGFSLWVKRIDIQIDSEPSFAIEGQVAFSLAQGMSTLFGHLRTLRIPS